MAKYKDEEGVNWITVYLIVVQLALLGLAISNVILNSDTLNQCHNEDESSSSSSKSLSIDEDFQRKLHMLSNEIDDIAKTLLLSRCIFQPEMPDLFVPESPDISNIVVVPLNFNKNIIDIFGGWDETTNEYVIPHDGVYQIDTRLTPFVLQNRGRTIYVMRHRSATTGETTLNQVSIWCNKNTNQGESPFDKSYTFFFHKADRVSIAFSYNDNDVQPTPLPEQPPTRLSHADYCGSNFISIFAINTLPVSYYH